MLSRWYEPFGQILAQKGTAVSTYGYLGAQLDRVTGLVYRHGRYYDPVTGRYLTPGGGANPYVAQVSGALLGPLAILSLAARRDRKRRKWMQALAVALLLLAVGGMLVSCDGRPDPTPQPPQPPTPPPTQPPAPPTQPPGPAPGRRTPSPVPPTPTSTYTPAPPPTCTPTSTPSPTPGNLPRRWFIAEDHDKPDNPKVIGHPEIGWSCSPTALFIVLRYAGLETDWNKVIAAVDAVPPKDGGLDDEWRESRCPTNHVCTSLEAIEMVARTYTNNVDAHENWEKDDIMKYIVQDIPVMVNYGGASLRSTGHSLVAYGYDLDQASESGGTFWFINPSGGGTTNMTWDYFKGGWAQSDYGDPRRRNSDGTYRPYHNWALAIRK